MTDCRFRVYVLGCWVGCGSGLKGVYNYKHYRGQQKLGLPTPIVWFGDLDGLGLQGSWLREKVLGEKRRSRATVNAIPKGPCI